MVDENEESGLSGSESAYSTKKVFKNMKVENKAKVQINSVNLYKEA